jgi:nitrate reductase gamma subunit
MYIWAKTPQPARMTLFPAPAAGAQTFWSVVKESLFFPGLFRGEKTLWVTAWIFHASLALILLGHLRVFTPYFDQIMVSLGVKVDTVSAVGGGAAGIVILVCVLVLLVRRFVLPQVREISHLSDLFALLLILAIILTGDLMRFGEHFDLALTRNYFAALLTFNLGSVQTPASAMFQVHFLLVQGLVMYVPFSKILHFGGIFFTQTLIQRN